MVTERQTKVGKQYQAYECVAGDRKNCLGSAKTAAAAALLVAKRKRARALEDGVSPLLALATQPELHGR